MSNSDCRPSRSGGDAPRPGNPVDAESKVPVVIAGGGPVGLTLAALLAHHGVASQVIEADSSYCEGSRAICISRRSQEIFGWIGGDASLVAKGLPWSGGRSYFRDTEVLHFEMPSDPRQRYAPMLNIQQFHVERIAHEAARGEAARAPAEVCWSSRVVALQQHADAVEVEIQGADGVRRRVRADWLIACDGGRSTVRELTGVAFDGMQYEGRYVIVDIEQDSHRPVERLAWFDPPSNPGSTILMHRQPDKVWRIDYQIGDDEDPTEAVQPENVLPRVQSHLDMIGETAPWKPLWISIYNAKCLTLDDYRLGRILFAGDAAHLVPIFGVRGLNSGIDDAANLAWKLARVIHGDADADLLDSYSAERVHATRENIAYGAKSTEFMAPPDFGFKLMREAALRLAGVDPAVRSLINPRQSTPISYLHSPLNATPLRAGADGPPGAGEPAPEARLDGRHLTTLFGREFVALVFSDEAIDLARLAACGITAWRISRRPDLLDRSTLHDDAGEAWLRYLSNPGTVVVVRPDGYILGRWETFDRAVVERIEAAMTPFHPRDHGSSAAAETTEMAAAEVLR